MLLGLRAVLLAILDFARIASALVVVVGVTSHLGIRLHTLFLSHPICFPFLFSLQHPLFSSLFARGKLRGNRQILGSEPSLRLVWAQNQPNLGQIGKIPGILQRTRVYLEITLRPPGYFVDFLNFASDFAPDQLSDSGKTASFQNGAPNTLCFP